MFPSVCVLKNLIRTRMEFCTVAGPRDKQMASDDKIINNILSGEIHAGKKKLKTITDEHQKLLEILKRVEDAIKDVVDVGFHTETDKIVNFLTAEGPAGRAAVNLFCNENAVVEKLRAALVTCSFTDVQRLIDQVSDEVGKNTHVIKVFHDSTADSIVDEVKKLKTDRCLVVVEQAESLPPLFLSRLLSLLSYVRTEQSRSRLFGKSVHVSLLVCLSTNPLIFASVCDGRALDLLELNTFSLSSPANVCSEVLEVLQNNPNDENKLYFSGKLGKKLEDSFRFADFSTQQLQKSIRFAVVQHFFKHPKWMEMDTSEFDAFMADYENVLEIFCEDREDSMMKPSEIHKQIQRNDKFWEDGGNSIVLEWRSQLSSFGDSTLADFIRDRMKKILPESAVLGEFKERVLKRVGELEMAVKVKEEERSEVPVSVEVKVDVNAPSSFPFGAPSTSSGASKSAKKGLADFQRSRQKRIAEMKTDPVMQARKNLIGEIEKGFRAVLIPFERFDVQSGCASRVIGCDSESSIRSTDEISRYIEETLLNDEKCKSSAVAVAMRTLFLRDNWKNVRVGEWAEEFHRHYRTSTVDSGHDTNTVFYSAVGHLEQMGMIKAGTDKKYPTVTGLYHPVHFMP